MFNNKNVLIGLTGGIACYKTCELIRLFKKEGANVKVIITENTLNFITINTLQTISQNKVYFNQFSNEWEPEHISLSNWAELFLIAPTTSNTIAKIANGICDNLLTSTISAFDKKIILVPAMNNNMWTNKINQENIKKIKKFDNFFIIDPEEGFLACNVNGIGRMAEPIDIFENTKKIYLYGKNNFLKNKKFIVTAGGTRENIDPIRCITNYSSGKMGIAMADAIFDSGGDVILISTININKKYKVINVESAIDILNTIKNNFDDETNIIMTASISDFKVKNLSTNKIKKNGNEGLVIEFIQNPDILKEISNIRSNKQKIIGFCAETENLIKNAKNKIKNKNLDYIVANDVSRKDIGFNLNYNEVILIDKNFKEIKIEKDIKYNVAMKILKIIFDN